MYIQPTFLPQATLLPEATFPLGPAQLNYTNVRAYERTSLRIATDMRPIHNVSNNSSLYVPVLQTIMH
jgi:hypothetical protein